MEKNRWGWDQKSLRESPEPDQDNACEGKRKKANARDLGPRKIINFAWTSSRALFLFLFFQIPEFSPTWEKHYGIQSN